MDGIRGIRGIRGMAASSGSTASGGSWRFGHLRRSGSRSGSFAREHFRDFLANQATAGEQVFVTRALDGEIESVAGNCALAALDPLLAATTGRDGTANDVFLLLGCEVVEAGVITRLLEHVLVDLAQTFDPGGVRGVFHGMPCFGSIC